MVDEWATAGKNGQPLPLFCYTIGFLAFFSIFISPVVAKVEVFFQSSFCSLARQEMSGLHWDV